MPTPRTRTRSRLFQGLFSAVFVGLLGTALIFATHADSTTIVQLYVSPSSGTQTVGKSFTVVVHLKKNDKTPINDVGANLTFPASGLSVVSVSTAGGYFDNPVTPGSATNFTRYNNTSGTIAIGATSRAPAAKATSYDVATIVFNAKAAGSAAIAFTAASSAGGTTQFGGTNQLTSTLGGTYTLAVANTPSPSPTPTPSPSPNPTPTPAPGPIPDPIASPQHDGSNDSAAADSGTQADANNTTDSTDSASNDATASLNDTSSTAPTISGLKISKITANGATVSWQTDTSTTSVLKYGTSQSSLSRSITDGSAQKSHSLTIKGQAAKQKIYFEIVATNADSVDAVQDGSFTALGGSKLASVIVAGSTLAVLLLLVGGSLALRKRRMPVLGTPKDIDTMNAEATPQATEPAVPPAEPQPVAAPEPPLPMSAPAAMPEPIAPPPAPAAAQDTPANPVSNTPPVAAVRPVPPVLPPQPSLRSVQSVVNQAPQPQLIVPPQPQLAPIAEPATPSASPTPSSLLATPQPVPPPAPAPLPPPVAPFATPVESEPADPDAIPDMFDEGEKRLEREEHDQQGPSA